MVHCPQNHDLSLSEHVDNSESLVKGRAQNPNVGSARLQDNETPLPGHDGNKRPVSDQIKPSWSELERTAMASTQDRAHRSIHVAAVMSS